MHLEDIRSTLATGLSLVKLKIEGHITWHFVIVLSSIKFLRLISQILKIGYIRVNYNDNLKYIFPIDQVCDWYHITTEVTVEDNHFRPRYGQVIVDIGGNIGLYTMYCAQKVGPKGLVLTTEPDPNNFIYLYANKKINDANNVFLLNIALASYVGKTKLFAATPTSHSIVKSFALAHGGTGSFIEVNCQTLDKVISDWKLRRIDLLNLDVEGAAFEIIKGSRNALKAKLIKRIKIEIEDNKELSLITRFLRKFSYKVVRRGIFLYALV